MEEVFEKLQEIKELASIGYKEVLNIKEVAALTGLSPAHIYRLTSEKRIPHYKPSCKMLYFNKAEINAWMQQNRVNTIEESEQQAAAYNINHNNQTPLCSK